MGFVIQSSGLVPELTALPFPCATFYTHIFKKLGCGGAGVL